MSGDLSALSADYASFQSRATAMGMRRFQVRLSRPLNWSLRPNAVPHWVWIALGALTAALIVPWILYLYSRYLALVFGEGFFPRVQ